MRNGDVREPVGSVAGTTAGTPWSFGFWFGFAYFPPASLVGREARM